MENILVADCGSTKCHWALINAKETLLFETKGFNPNVQSVGELSQIVSELNFNANEITKIYFLGAGCGSTHNNLLVNNLLSENFKNSEIKIQNDIYASALACLGKNNGIACILGTGSNVCKWENQQVVDWLYTFGLGYILGDEGSGAYLGKCLLKAYFSNELSAEINQKIENLLGTYSDIITNVYKNINPNIYLSKLATFVYDHKNDESIQKVIHKNFDDFVERNLLKINDITSFPIGFTGSIAYFFKDELENVLKKYHLNLFNIVKNPIDGLINYYKI